MKNVLCYCVRMWWVLANLVTYTVSGCTNENSGAEYYTTRQGKLCLMPTSIYTARHQTVPIL